MEVRRTEANLKVIRGYSRRKTKLKCLGDGIYQWLLSIYIHMIKKR